METTFRGIHIRDTKATQSTTDSQNNAPVAFGEGGTSERQKEFDRWKYYDPHNIRTDLHYHITARVFRSKGTDCTIDGDYNRKQVTLNELMLSNPINLFTLTLHWHLQSSDQPLREHTTDIQALCYTAYALQVDLVEAPLEAKAQHPIVVCMVWRIGGILAGVTVIGVTNSEDYDVLYNKNLPLAISISKTTIQSFDPKHANCEDDYIEAAKTLLSTSLKETKSRSPFSPELRETFERFYVDHTDYGSRCPQAVMASCLLKTEHILQNVLKYSDRETKRDNAAYIFDIWETYYFYKYWLFDMYHSGGDDDPQVALEKVYFDWPLDRLEVFILRLYRRLWGQTFDTSNYCQCVEGYDYTLTMQGSLDSLLSDERAGKMSLGSLLDKMSDQKHCIRWQRESSEPLFWLQSLKSECVPGALLDFLTCWIYWTKEGHLGAILNIAETMAQLTTLASECLDDDIWAFDTVNTILYNFARMAKTWDMFPPGVEVRDPNGRVVAAADPRGARNASALAWSAYPAAEYELLSSRVDKPPMKIDLEASCIYNNSVLTDNGNHLTELIAATENAKLSVPVFGRDRDAMTLRWSLRTALVIPISGYYDNLWHNFHWLLRSFGRLVGLQPSQVRVVLLYVKLDENDMHTLTPRFVTNLGYPEPDLIKKWYASYGPILNILSDLPPLLFTDHKADACYPNVRWGGDDTRADRQSRQVEANSTIRAARDLRKALLGPSASATMADNLRKPQIIIIQRSDGHGRIIRNAEDVARKFGARIEKLSRKQSLLEQAKIIGSVNVIIGAHGAGLSWMMFASPPAAVIELVAAEVPETILTCSGQWNKDKFSIYGGMARLVGVHHICLRMRTRLREVLTLQEVSTWRSWDIWADHYIIAQALNELTTLHEQQSVSYVEALGVAGTPVINNTHEGVENKEPNNHLESPLYESSLGKREKVTDVRLGSIISLIEKAEEKSETVLEGLRSGRGCSAAQSLDSCSLPANGASSTRGNSEIVAKLQARVATLTAEVADKASWICDLRQKLEEQDRMWANRIREAEHEAERKIQTIKRELASKGDRQLKMIDKLLIDKTELTKQCEELVEELRGSEKRAEMLKEEAEEHLVREVSKQKKLWMAQEKLRRSEWESTKTKEIKEATIRGLEPEVERILSEARKEKQALTERHRDALSSLRAELTEQHKLQLETRIEALKRECDALLLVERDRCRRQVAEESEKWSEQLRLLRSSHQQEIAEMRAKAEEERSRLDVKIREGMHQARLEEHSRAKEAERRFEEELERMRAAKESEIKDVKRAEQVEREAWMDSIREKLEGDLKHKEGEIRKECEIERDRQVAVVVDRLSREVVEAEHRSKASAVKEWERQKADLMEQLADLRTKVRFVLMQHFDESQMAVAGRERENLDAEIRKLKEALEATCEQLRLTREQTAQSEQRHKDMILGYEREKSKAMLEIEKERQTSVGEKEQLKRETARLEGELSVVRANMMEKLEEQKINSDEVIRSLEDRVRRMLNRKDEVIEELREKLTKADAFAKVPNSSYYRELHFTAGAQRYRIKTA
ncbi:5-azacytidine induced [Perkinsus chesapeaki]|uniref:5-azacytidine induced n=1 Tax=Perkinsus chesapeaki TaxID=330153 RepID=A0A7J6LKM0_PERCH|nr:5-azacytidine induced [Perkinsus chesapeaki]